ncbi:MAG: NAD(P)H-hydrate dehydratase [Candidatus Omnitrophica bacterium]|nr:NAD(P)H-hydrate dehydratase [Candidatus Omnitrophota bacterium]
MRLPTRLLRRRLNVNKGDFGHILILAGSANYSGAASLCSLAAMRSGAGLVTLGIPKSINTAMIKIKPKEVMTFPLPETKKGTLSSAGFKKIKELLIKTDILVIGPGLGRNEATYSLIRKTIGISRKPTVIDADGLNALTGHLSILLRTGDRRPATIMTPHPGEMARLLGVSVKKVQGRRKEIVKEFAKKYKVVLVLKGHKTVISDSSGNFYLNKSGNPGMATAGSGDVLTGMIAAFLGQGLGAFEAAKSAVYLHGVAGDMAAREKTQISLIASDIIDKIPKVFKRLKFLLA